MRLTAITIGNGSGSTSCPIHTGPGVGNAILYGNSFETVDKIQIGIQIDGGSKYARSMEIGEARSIEGKTYRYKIAYSTLCSTN